LDDPLPIDPVGIALQVERPLGDVAEHRLGDLLVVAREVGLGDARGKQRLLGAGDRDLPAARLDRQGHRLGAFIGAYSTPIGVTYPRRWPCTRRSRSAFRPMEPASTASWLCPPARSGWARSPTAVG